LKEHRVVSGVLRSAGKLFHVITNIITTVDDMTFKSLTTTTKSK